MKLYAQQYGCTLHNADHAGFGGVESSTSEGIRKCLDSHAVTFHQPLLTRPHYVFLWGFCVPIGLVWSYDTRSVRGYSIHTLSTRFCPGKVERRPGQTRAGLCRPACLQSARSPQQREQATHCPRADRGRMREGRPLARLVDEIKSQCTFCSWIVFIMCLDWIQVRAADC
jgi:hypothetical protein